MVTDGKEQRICPGDMISTQLHGQRKVYDDQRFVDMKTYDVYGHDRLLVIAIVDGPDQEDSRTPVGAKGHTTHAAYVIGVNTTKFGWVRIHAFPGTGEQAVAKTWYMAASFSNTMCKSHVHKTPANDIHFP